MMQLNRGFSLILAGGLAAATAALGGCSDDESAGTSADTASVLVPDVAADTGSAATGDTSVTSSCGDGFVQASEVCDDGDNNGYYGFCNIDCSGPAPRCGDGVVDANETCDDGDGVNGTYGKCGAACNGPAPFCGNGFVDGGGEVCDDGKANGEYEACKADCSGPGPECGDGNTDVPWEVCDDGPFNGLPGQCDARCGASPGCGDGVVESPEECDDGADNGTYGHCTSDCSGPGPVCGDGVAQQNHEACDHGEMNGSYGYCKTDCSGLGPHCGDAQIDPEELCDDGDLNGTIGHCRVDCTGRTLPWTAYPTHDAAAAKLSGTACNPHDWLAKYMRYRVRLRGNGSAAQPGFVSIGSADGESIPASHRAPHENCTGYWGFASCPKQDDPDAQGIYKWGDATIWLGVYFEVLAMEYAMFDDLGLDTTQTIDDLHLAMEAFNRVDENAERYFGVPPARDGFFLRDDVPEDFAVRSDGSYRFPRDDGAIRGYECVASDLACDPPSIEDGSYVSQDQVIGLLHGLALVATLVPGSVQREGTVLPDAAREMIHRMVYALREAGWKVKDPTGDSPPDKWGGNAIGFSNQFAKTANAFVGDAYGVEDYRTFSSRVAGEAAWAGLQVIWRQTHNYNRTMALRLSAMTSVWSPGKMTRWAVGDSKDFYALTHSLLNNTPMDSDFSYWRIESVLDSAPCDGPCRGYADCSDTHGWQGPSRIMGPTSRTGSRHNSLGEFNGMDYMALHNAYYLVRKGAYGFDVPAVDAGTDCSGFVGLDDILANGPTDGQTYDPEHTCSRADLGQRFCGRSWGSWIDDAYRGAVTIHTRGGRWVCDDQQPCRIVADDDENTSGDDLIIGSPGDDHLKGSGGNDCIIGLGGNDLLEGGQGYDELHGGDGDDELYGEGNNWIVLDGERDELHGGPGNDFLKGGPAADALYGDAGNDELIGDGGDDILVGGPGNDTLEGDSGEDHLTGGDGDDSLIGDSGSDVLWGGAGRDKLDGESGDDFCDGGEGDDFVRGGDGDDVLIAGTSGADRLCGNRGDDVLWGGWDGDECRGGGFLGGTDEVNGCDDDSAGQSDCNNSAFDDW